MMPSMKSPRAAVSSRDGVARAGVVSVMAAGAPPLDRQPCGAASVCACASVEAGSSAPATTRVMRSGAPGGAHNVFDGHRWLLWGVGLYTTTVYQIPQEARRPSGASGVAPLEADFAPPSAGTVRMTP